MSPKKVYDLQEAKVKIEQYCVYQDRCFLEVEQKLKSYGLIQVSIDFLIDHLMENNFVNEERFARSFVRGAYRHKKWGRKKIIQALKLKQLTQKCISIGLEEIDREEYFGMIEHELKKKANSTKAKSEYEKKNKILRFGLSRGYEYDIMMDILE
jgi:regulatory protein